MVDDSSDDVTVVDEETGEAEIFKYTGGSKTAFYCRFYWNNKR